MLTFFEGDPIKRQKLQDAFKHLRAKIRPPMRRPLRKGQKKALTPRFGILQKWNSFQKFYANAKCLTFVQFAKEFKTLLSTLAMKQSDMR